MGWVYLVSEDIGFAMPVSRSSAMPICETVFPMVTSCTLRRSASASASYCCRSLSRSSSLSPGTSGSASVTLSSLTPGSESHQGGEMQRTEGTPCRVVYTPYFVCFKVSSLGSHSFAERRTTLCISLLSSTQEQIILCSICSLPPVKGAAPTSHRHHTQPLSSYKYHLLPVGFWEDPDLGNLGEAPWMAPPLY